jgi:leucyl aminopeptidase
MEFSTKPGPIESIKTDCIAVGVYADGKLSAAAARLDRATHGALRAAVASGDMQGKRGTIVVLRALPGVASARIALVGLGKADEFGDRAFVEAVKAAVKGAGAGVARLAIDPLGWTVKGRDAHWTARTCATTAREAAFRADELKSGKGGPLADGDAGAKGVSRVDLIVEKRDAEAERGLAEGRALANGVEFAKRLGNLPANVCTPDYLAQQARKLAREWGLEAQILDQRRIEALGMGSFLSVARGSEQPPRLIVLKYRGGGRGGFADPIALVGKGITFDSGGISIKPAANMDEMKFDMCGAASVLGTLRAIAELKPRINVVGVVPACENLPSGRANKPGDIVTSMSGQTIEVLNTDAEGRLILCDALTYVQRFKPAAIIDVATLTGACVTALGNVNSGLFSTDEALAGELLAAGRAAGDAAWRMPLDDEYQDQLKSNFADIANIGSPANAGAVAAACFLSRFTRQQRWAHLDIAGTAYRGGAAKGATGRPVPLLTQFLLARAG